MPLPVFFAQVRRTGVSELYAALLMMGITLALGSLVVAAATSQFGSAADSASLGASLVRDSADTQVSLIYLAVQGSSSCPVYQGEQEGTAVEFALYNYGSEAFVPIGFVVNSSLYSGAFKTVDPGTLTSYSLSLSSCAHQAGETLLAYDAAGTAVQFAT